jgi:hypothetical protein
MLVTVDNEAPASVVERGGVKDWKEGDLLPELKYWSDADYLYWAQLADDTDVLKYVVRLGVANKATLTIISEILNRHPDLGPFPIWPGIQLDIETDQANALLGTPNGAGVA